MYLPVDMYRYIRSIYQVYHGFYQWVGMVLFGQSIMFYIPHFLWKSCEGKRVERLVSG